MTGTSETFDVLVVGGGVVGLSLAWELAQAGAQVCVADQGSMGGEASWAAAGMLPPGPERSHWSHCTAYDRLQGLGHELHPEWHTKLARTVGIDNGYRLSGAIYLAESAEIFAAREEWARFGLSYEELDGTTLAELEPSLVGREKAFFLPSEGQLRPPRHLKALVAACHHARVSLKPGCQVLDWRTSRKIDGVVTDHGTISAGQYCLTSGCWTGLVASRLGLQIPMRPVRGQMLLLNGSAGVLRRIVNRGPRYLTPREDGRVLVGSTQEDAGFHKQNTVVGVGELLNFARHICPPLGDFKLEQCWSGLRPRSADDLPYLGRLPRYENGWIAAGHFRAGIQLSPATAVAMRAMMLGDEPPIDVNELSLDRLRG